jgi:hypothetical protein
MKYQISNIHQTQISKNSKNPLAPNRLEVLASVEAVLDFDLNLLIKLEKLSKSIIKRWFDRDEQIIIPFDILEYVNSQIWTDIQKYITNTEFKKKIISVLGLEKNYWFFIDNLSSQSHYLTYKQEIIEEWSILPQSINAEKEWNLVLIPINYDENRGTRFYRNAWIGENNLDYLFKVLSLESKEKRISFVENINKDIDLSKLSKEELSEYFSSWNYLNFLFEKLIKEIYNYSNWNIDREISIWLAWAMLREDFDMELSQINDFFNIISKLVKVPREKNKKIYIPLSDLSEILEQKQLSAQKFITNPLFKKKIRQTLTLENNYWLVINTNKQKIVMIPVDDGVRRYSWVSKKDVEYITTEILKLETKGKRTSYIDSIISNIDVSKFSKDDILNRFSKWKYVNYVYTELAKSIYNLAWWNIDLDMARGVAGALFREDFDFVNSSIWCNVLDKFSITLWLNVSRLYRIDDELEQKLKTSIDVLEDLLKQNLSLSSWDIEVNKFRKNFTNDIFTEFSLKVKNSFEHSWFWNIDDDLIKWMFMYVVHKWDIKNPMKDFTEIVFSRIESKLNQLSILFWFFNSHVLKIWNESYAYPNFKFRDIEIDDDKYSVKKVFSLIAEKLERFHFLTQEIARVSRPLVDVRFSLTSNKKVMQKLELEIPKIETDLKTLISEIETSTSNIPSWAFNHFKRKKALREIIELENIKIDLEKKLSDSKSNLSQLKKKSQDLLETLSSSPIKEEIDLLEKEKKLLEEQIERIKEDFSNTLFYWLRQDKK